MTLEEYIKEQRKRVDNMTLAQARQVVADRYGHDDMRIECEKAVWMLLNCADEKINSGWIPVTERLPEEGQMVIACYPTDCGKRVMTAYYYKECGFSCGITYAWMPLPEPYEEDKE